MRSAPAIEARARIIGDALDSSGTPTTFRPTSSPSTASPRSLRTVTLRCGWIISSEEALASIRDWIDHFEFGVSKLSHAVAALVLDDCDRFAAYADAILAAAHPILDRHFRQWSEEGLASGKLPSFGCIFFPRLTQIEDTLGFSELLADR